MDEREPLSLVQKCGDGGSEEPWLKMIARRIVFWSNFTWCSGDASRFPPNLWRDQTRQLTPAYHTSPLTGSGSLPANKR